MRNHSFLNFEPKSRDSDFAQLFEDRTKSKVHSEITPPLHLLEKHLKVYIFVTKRDKI